MPSLTAIFAQAVGSFPLSFRARLGRYLGYLFSIARTRDRKIAELQMKTFLGPKGSAFLPGVYASLGETLCEALNLKPLLANYREYVDADWAQMDEVLSRGKPIIILSAHTGNWELLAACAVKRGYDLAVVGREAKNAQLQRVLRGIREQYGVNTIWKSGREAVEEIIHALENRRSVAALIDQDTSVTNVMVPFFGRVAACPATIIELGKQHGAVFVAPLIFRTKTNHYRISMKELDAAKPTVEMLTAFNSFLEESIRSNPAQWVWFHKRWRTLADGTRLSSRDYVASLE